MSLSSYADVRAHKRKELGIVVEEDSSVARQPETSLYDRKETCSPSAGSVTSVGRQESNWSSSHDSLTDQNSGGILLYLLCIL